MRRRVIGTACFVAFSALLAAGAAAQTYIQPPVTPAPSGPLQILPPTLSADLRIVWEV